MAGARVGASEASRDGGSRISREARGRPVTSPRNFIVECYLPGIAERDVAEAATRAGLVAQELSGRGADIAYLGATFVEADEVVFHAFRASDKGVVEEASRAAGLAFERVVESIAVGGGTVATVVDDGALHRAD